MRSLDTEEGSDDGHEPLQVYGSNQVELAWTVTPALIAQMRRTAGQPLAAERPRPGSALRFSCFQPRGTYLAVAIKVLASLMVATTLASYLFIYTPLNRKTLLCTLAGAFAGVMPHIG